MEHNNNRQNFKNNQQESGLDESYLIAAACTING
jgi:hypothetical protein